MMRLEEITMIFTSRKGVFRSSSVKAIDGVSLDIGKGETVALVGESGSGKTTLGRISLRLIKPTQGRVYFEDSDITDLDNAQLKFFRRKAQAVFQDPYSSIDPFMTVFQIIEEPLIIHGIASGKERAEQIFKSLENVRLTPPQEISEKYPHLLSGGQRQRVSIARSLVLNPCYIVADEPVSMIDASSRVEILDLMKKLQDKYSISFLYITHDIATAKYFSDRLAVMHKGKIVEIGQSAEVVNNPVHPYTKRLIEAVPEPDPSNRFRDRPVLDEDISLE